MQAGVLPLLIALALAGFIRVIGGPERGPRLMGVAVVAGLLFALALSAGVPRPPPSPAQKIFYLVILGAVVGFALDMAGRPVRPQETLRVILPGLALLWLAWGQLVAGVALAELATLAALWGGGTLVFARLERAEAQAGGLSAAIMLIAAALGVAGIASLASSSAVALSAVALAAATGGLAIWGYGVWLVKRTRRPSWRHHFVRRRRRAAGHGLRPGALFAAGQSRGAGHSSAGVFRRYGGGAHPAERYPAQPGRGTDFVCHIGRHSGPGGGRLCPDDIRRLTPACRCVRPYGV